MLNIRYRQSEADQPGGLSGLARDLLHEALDEFGIPEGEREIVQGRYGKPYLKDSRVFFNLSHSGDYALCVLSDTEVGCDIQQIRPVREAVMNRYYHDEEKEYIDAASTERERMKRFARIWALRESYVKMTGEGLTRNLGTFWFRITGEGPVLCLADPSQESIRCDDPAFYEFEIEDYVCACCCKKTVDNPSGQLYD